jgi:hypothetical protein
MNQHVGSRAPLPVTHNLTLMTMGGRIDAWLAEAFMEVVWEIAVT